MGKFGRVDDDDVVQSLTGTVQLARGTGCVPRLSITAERGAWIRRLQAEALRAVEAGDIDAARAAVSELRASELDGDFDKAAAALGAARDPRSADDEVAVAIRRICRLRPAVAPAPEANGDAVDPMRAGYARHQQQLARVAIARGHVGAARLSLRVLRPSDFDAEERVSQELLAVMRSSAASDDDVIAVALALIRLPVRGVSTR